VEVPVRTARKTCNILSGMKLEISQW
jgi:hypothetical protein